MALSRAVRLWSFTDHAERSFTALQSSQQLLLPAHLSDALSDSTSWASATLHHPQRGSNTAGVHHHAHATALFGRACKNELAPLKHEEQHPKALCLLHLLRLCASTGVRVQGQHQAVGAP